MNINDLMRRTSMLAAAKIMMMRNNTPNTLSFEAQKGNTGSRVPFGTGDDAAEPEVIIPSFTSVSISADNHNVLTIVGGKNITSSTVVKLDGVAVTGTWSAVPEGSTDLNTFTLTNILSPETTTEYNLTIGNTTKTFTITVIAG